MKIIINSKVLIDFVKCVDKAIKKPQYIFFERNNNVLVFGCMEYDATVLKKIYSEGVDFKLGLDASDLMLFAKKLNEDDLIIEIIKKKVIFTIGNVVASYVPVDLTLISSDWNTDLFGDIGIMDSKTSWVVDSLIKCADSVETVLKDDLRFQDILLQSDDFTYMTRFTEAAVRILATENIGFKGRIVVPAAAAKVAKAFNKRVYTCYLGEKYFGLIIRYNAAKGNLGDILVKFPLMQDNYPQECLTFLHLNNNVKLIDTNRPGYWFNRDHLIQAIDLVSSTMKDEGQVRFEIIGQQESGFPVWKISSASYKGNYCEETIGNLASGNLHIEPFRMNGKKVIKALESYEESVVFYDHSRSIFALSDSEGSDLTLLAKSSG